ncbi:MAG: hypothetical protein ACYSUN_02530 [Planctomycetota bacterium]|jgi:hypothetical protein
MNGAIERLLSVRRGPRPDPLPDQPGPAWQVHAPWATVLVFVIAGAFFLSGHDFGLLAVGAGLCALALSALSGKLGETCRAVHIAGGILALAVVQDAAAAGAFALPLGLFLAAALAGRAAATYITPSVAPLAGRLPWRFEDAYKQQALQFAVCGLGASLAVAAMGPTVVFKILGVALLPLSLRVYSGHLLSPAASRRIWLAGAATNLFFLILFAPFAGAAAAALGVLTGESVMALGSLVSIGDRTGATLFPKLRLAVAAGAILVLGPLAVPGGAVWLLIALLAASAVWGMLRATRQKNQAPS